MSAVLDHIKETNWAAELADIELMREGFGSVNTNMLCEVDIRFVWRADTATGHGWTLEPCVVVVNTWTTIYGSKSQRRGLLDAFKC